MSKTRKWFETFGTKINLKNKEQMRKDALEDPIVIELMKIAFIAGRDQLIMKQSPTFDELMEELKR